MKRKTSSRPKTVLSREKELKIFREIINILNSNLDINIILHNIISLMMEFTKADSCFLYVMDKSSRELVLAASSNPHPGVLRQLRLKIGEGITGWVAKERQTVVIPENAYKDPRFKVFSMLPEDRYKCFVGIPILLNDDVVGVINFQHKSKKKYAKSTLTTLETIAKMVSGLIRNAWLYEEMRVKNLHLESILTLSKRLISSSSLDEILDLVVNILSDVMSSPICSVMLINEKKRVLEIKAAKSLIEDYREKPPIRVGEGITGKVVEEKKMAIVKNVLEEPDFKMKDIAEKQGLRSMISMPMIVRSKAVGAINVYSKEEKDFSEDEISWLEVIANQSAIAIENARLESDTKASKEALEARKLIERAKGIIMKELNLGEEAAYRLIHKKSMDSCRPMKEIAQAIILSRELSNA